MKIQDLLVAEWWGILLGRSLRYLSGIKKKKNNKKGPRAPRGEVEAKDTQVLTETS